MKYQGQSYAVAGRMEVLATTTAQTLGTYEEKFYTGNTAITRNSFGKGRATYVDVIQNLELLKAVIRDVWKEPIRALLSGGFATMRANDAARYTFYLVPPKTVEVELFHPGAEVLSGGRVQGVITIKPWDLVTLQGPTATSHARTVAQTDEGEAG